MPLIDIRVLLRVASSDALRPRVMQGSAVALEATVIDQAGAGVAGASVTLLMLSPAGVALSQTAASGADGIASALFPCEVPGEWIARATVTSPQAEVAERRFDVLATGISAVPFLGFALLTADGFLLLARDGRMISTS